MSTKTQKTSPFKPNGVLKKDFFDHGGKIYKNVSGTFFKTIKVNSEFWTMKDCPSIIRRLLNCELEIKDIAKKTGYSVSYLERILKGGKMTNSVFGALKTIEEDLKDAAN